MPVAIYVAHAGIVGRIGVTATVGGNAFGRLLNLYGQIAYRGIGTKGEAAIHAATFYFVKSVLTSQWLMVYEECAPRGKRHGIELLTVSEHVEGFALLVGTERAPAHDNAAVLPHGHDTTVEPFGGKLLVVISCLAPACVRDV